MLSEAVTPQTILQFWPPNSLNYRSELILPASELIHPASELSYSSYFTYSSLIKLRLDSYLIALIS